MLCHSGLLGEQYRLYIVLQERGWAFPRIPARVAGCRLGWGAARRFEQDVGMLGALYSPHGLLQKAFFTEQVQELF